MEVWVIINIFSHQPEIQKVFDSEDKVKKYTKNHPFKEMITYVKFEVE